MVLAVIFDLDGTVLSNEDEYGDAFRKVLTRLGKRVETAYPHVGGIGVKENWPILLSKYKIRTEKTIEELTQETQEAYLADLPKVTLKPGFEVFVRELKEGGVLVALATSNVLWILEEVFETLSLKKFFDVVTTGEEVKFKKPAPDLFLLTAEKLGVDPKECLVIEDSEAGIEAAHKAQMKVFAIARDASHARSLRNADRVVSSFEDISLSTIQNL